MYSPNPSICSAPDREYQNIRTLYRTSFLIYKSCQVSCIMTSKPKKWQQYLILFKESGNSPLNDHIIFSSLSGVIFTPILYFFRGYWNFHSEHLNACSPELGSCFSWFRLTRWTYTKGFVENMRHKYALDKLYKKMTEAVRRIRFIGLFEKGSVLR